MVISPEDAFEILAVKAVAEDDKKVFLICAATEYPDRFTASPFASVTVTVVVKVAPLSINIFEILASHTVSFLVFIMKMC